MSRKYEKKFKYKYTKYDPELRIVSTLQLNKFKDYAHPIDSDSGITEYQDDKYSIIYNHIYYDKETNEPFIVVNRYYLNPRDESIEKFNPSLLRLKIQFIPTKVLRQVTYYSFIYDETFYDPYYPTMYNNNCAIGNIIYENEYDREFKLWKEMMRRCYDHSHRLYSFYGALGAVPAVPSWRIYEFFHRYWEQAYENTFLMPDPNDPMMYYFPAWDPNREQRTHIARCTIDEVPDHKPTVQWMTRVPFMDRTSIEYTRPGRPSNRLMEPSPNLIRHEDQSTPRNKLYTLLRQDELQMYPHKLSAFCI